MSSPPGRVMAMAAAFRRLYLPSARSSACSHAHNLWSVIWQTYR